MRAYMSMPSNDFLYQIRDIAIAAKAKPMVIFQIDALMDAPSEDEIKTRCDDARDAGIDRGRDAGIDRGREVEWEICFDALDAALRDKRGPKLGLTTEQVEAILTVLTVIKPE